MLKTTIIKKAGICNLTVGSLKMKCKEYKLPKIGLKVQIERKLRGYSQQDFAKMCGLSKSQLCKIELNQYKTMT
ncbi:MAG: helix-turn-helix domain-containing protein [Eubacterium sp.]